MKATEVKTKTHARAPVHFNGPAILAAMMREVDPKFRKALYEKLGKISPILLKVVEQFEFVFSDLILLEDKSLQLLLTKFPDTDWLIAWKLCDEKLKDRLLENMSPRKKEDFLHQAQQQPRLLKQQVVRTQMTIAKAAKALLADGKLRMHSKRRYINLA
jgi:flagellar motor switch protein FliG